MEKFTISRDDSVYECFTDVVKTRSGVLICTYRESVTHSMSHGGEPDLIGFCRIVVRRSLDDGRHWTPRQVVCGSENLWEGPGYNCPRLLACQDGTVMLIVDLHPPIARGEYEYNDVQALLTAGKVVNIIFRSRDDGQTWTGPQETTMNCGHVPSIKQLRNGDLLVGVSNAAAGGQLVHRSVDGGETWSEPVVVPYDEFVDQGEGDFVELDDGTVVMYMRADKSWTGMRSLSRDGGRTWSKLEQTFMILCRGRPSAGLLSTGEVFITHRIRLPGPTTPSALMMYVETQQQAVGGDVFVDYTSPDQRRFLMLDMDRNIVSDTGYSGWTELDDGSVLVVNYINDDAPKAQIRGYIVNRRDWVLSPPGGMPFVGKSEWFMDKRQLEVGTETYRGYRNK